jgi:PAS domain S-box-containing protein
LAGTANYFAGSWGAETVTRFDPLWTAPLLLGAFLAGTWDAGAGKAGDVETSVPRQKRSRLEVGIMALIPLAVVLLSALVADEQQWLAVITASISLTAYGLRLALTQTRQEDNFLALQASEVRYRTLFENNLAGVFRSTLEGRFLDCNQAFARLFGYTREEMLALHAGALYHQPSEREERIALLHHAGSITNLESTFRRRDGSSVRVIQNVVLRTDEHGASVLEGTMLDISERKLLEQQLFHAQKMEAVGRLAGGVAHDFNNLLSVILGYSDLLVDALSGDKTNRARAEGIRGAGERAASLTRQLLAFSRQQVLEPRMLDVRRTVTEMQTLLRRLIGEDISLVIQPGRQPALVKSDPSQLEQVIMNLAVNARDAMPQGGRLTIEIDLIEFDAPSAQQHPGLLPGSYVMLALSDTGHGMDPETQARIFEPFFTTKEKGKGTGLGLATVFGIVKQSEGHIWFSSEPGLGTTFKIFLPRVTEALEPERTAREAARPSGGSETIMLVEDETSLRELTTEFLVHGGYTVRAARNGEEAFAWAAQQDCSINLLVTDVVLPGMSGPALAQKLSEQMPGLRILYVSGYTADAIVHHGVLEAGLWFLQKPFSRDALLRKVREILDSHATG